MMGSVLVISVLVAISRFAPAVLSASALAAEEQTPVVASPVKLYGGAVQSSAAGASRGTVIVPPANPAAKAENGSR
jgi:hypothetical protein